MHGQAKAKQQLQTRSAPRNPSKMVQHPPHAVHEHGSKLVCALPCHHRCVLSFPRAIQLHAPSLRDDPVPLHVQEVQQEERLLPASRVAAKAPWVSLGSMGWVRALEVIQTLLEQCQRVDEALPVVGSFCFSHMAALALHEEHDRTGRCTSLRWCCAVPWFAVHAPRAVCRKQMFGKKSAYP